jgi:hypothetical protein
VPGMNDSSSRASPAAACFGAWADRQRSCRRHLGDARARSR